MTVIGLSENRLYRLELAEKSTGFGPLIAETPCIFPSVHGLIVDSRACGVGRKGTNDALLGKTRFLGKSPQPLDCCALGICDADLLVVGAAASC